MVVMFRFIYVATKPSTALLIEFNPVMYTVTEGGSGMFQIVKRGQAAVPVSVSLSTGQPSDTASGMLWSMACT